MRRKAVYVTEGELQRATLDLARLLGWRIARFPMLNLTADRKPRRLAYDTKGFPDALLVRDRLLAIEFKSETGRMSAEQDAWNDALVKAGVLVAVFRPRDWTSGVVEAVLRQCRDEEKAA